MNTANKAQPGMQQTNQHQQNPSMQMNQMQQSDFGMNFGDTSTGPGGESFNLDFSTLENADVLENFDFDSFLNTTGDDGFNFNADELGPDFNMQAD